MAIIKMGAVVTDIRNSLGGHVFSRGRSGAIMRTKVTPLNPQTTFQQASRAKLAAISTQWRGLTEARRIAWNNAVENFLGTNVFGDSVRPTGKNLFTGLNINLLNVGEVVIPDPPLPVESVSPTISAFVATAGVPALSYDFVNVSAGQTILVSCTTSLSPGVFFVSSEFRVVTTTDQAVAGTIDILAAYNARFGALVAGTKLFLRTTPISVVSGQAGVEEVLSVIVAA